MVQLFSRKQLTCTPYAWQKSRPISQECLFQTEIILLKKKKKERQTDRVGRTGRREGGWEERMEERKEEGRERGRFLNKSREDFRFYSCLSAF